MIDRRTLLQALALAPLLPSLRPGGRAAHAAPADEGEAVAALNALYERTFERQLALNPGWAISLGREEYLGQFSAGLSDRYLRANLDLAQEALATLDAHDPMDLPENARLSYDIFRHDMVLQRDFYGSDLAAMTQKMPIDQMRGLHSSFAVTASGSSSYPFRTVTHYEKSMERAGEFADAVDLAVERMREGMAAGLTVPRILAQKVLPQIGAHIGKPPEETVFFRPVEEFPEDFSAADRERLRAAFRRTIADTIQPAYARLHRFIEEEYLPNARESDGIAALPDGAALYAYLVRSHTSLDLPAEEIHRIGLEEVARITEELDALRRRVNFEGSVTEFLAEGRNNPDLRFESSEDKLQRFRAAKARIRERLPALFSTFPEAEFEIRPVPDYLEESQPAAYYESPAPDGSRPGIFWINTLGADEEPAIDIITLSLHEAMPGHHMQISLAQELEDLPAFRRHSYSTAYVEGWGLYAETLGEDMGFYDDPWQYLGHLSWDIHRANRLVVDTGIHALGWTREQGID